MLCNGKSWDKVPRYWCGIAIMIEVQLQGYRSIGRSVTIASFILAQDPLQQQILHCSGSNLSTKVPLQKQKHSRPAIKIRKRIFHSYFSKKHQGLINGDFSHLQGFFIFDLRLLYSSNIKLYLYVLRTIRITTTMKNGIQP